MNNVNMGGMNTMGGPVGGGMPMMNNGAPGGGIRQQVPVTERSQLNTYIYDYFLRNGNYDVARALLQSDCGVKVIKDSPDRRRDEDGNEEDPDSKDNIDTKRPDDLPPSDVPRECPESCFLYEWWCLFWDMFNAQRGKGQGQNVLNYVNHTNAQSRMRQEGQQNMLRGISRGGMMGDAQYQNMMRMNQANGVQNELQRKAMQNNRNATPQQQMMLAKQQQQQAMQRDPSSGDHQQRSGSPNSAENAPSPSKRPRIDGGNNFPQQMPNGRGQPMPQQVGDSGPSNAIQAAHMQLANGIEPNNLTAQQFQNMPANAAQARSLAGYQAGLAQQQAGQMPGKGMPNPNGPANQGSPMMNQGQDGGAIAGYYNAGEMGTQARMGQPGQQAAGGGNHALQDYQMQLMLLEQQNKKRLMMARQEQDNMAIPGQRDASGGPGMGPGGQPFQQGTSPQGARSVNSPNPSDQMKRGTPHMNPAGIPSPMPEGQSRGSPSNMGFMPGTQMDPNMGQQYFMKNGMDPNMVGAMPNGMRPPSSHPPGFNAQGMAANQMTMAQQAQRQQSVNGAWPGQNGQMMAGQPQGVPQQMGQNTPQQRPMAPPAAPGVVANGRTQPSSPQQNAQPPTPQPSNKTNPKKKGDTKDSKAKRATKKGNATTGATPSADSAQEPATPTPATPITPVHPKSFNGQNGSIQQPVTNGQPGVPMNNGIQQPDPGLTNFDLGNNDFNLNGFEFANNGSTDVLQDFDFDSFLHQDGDGVGNFDFDASNFLESGEIGAE